jgi:enoyl-CoA hydratase
MQQSDDDLVLVRDERATRVLTLNRPAKRNAMNDALLHRLQASLRAALADESVRTIVLTGAGDCFSAGRDLGNVGTGTADPVRLEDGSLEATVDVFTDVLCLLLEASKPTIAAVRGFAVGGGQALTLACDFVVAETTAQFGCVEMVHGFPAAMNTVLLGRQLGRRLALEIALTGTLRSAAEYQALGLVNRVCDPGSLESATRELADLLNERTPWSVRRTKQLFAAAEDAPLAAAVTLGSQLNQLLRLNNGARQSASGSDGLRATIKAAGAGVEPPPT